MSDTRASGPAWGRWLVPAALMSWPAPARAAVAGVETAWIVAALAVTVAVGALAAAALAGRRLRRLRAAGGESADFASRLDAAFAAVGVGAYFWPREAGGGEGVSANLADLLKIRHHGPPRFADLKARLAQDDARKLTASVRGLRRGGKGFAFTVRAAKGDRRFRAVGLRASQNHGAELDLLCLQDVSDEVGEIESLKGEAVRLRAMLDALPVPVWLRDRNLKLVDGNLAYAKAVEAKTPSQAVTEGREIASGASEALAARARKEGVGQSERRHAVVDGARRLLDLSEVPLPDGEFLAGFALDYSQLADAKAELSRHVAAHGEVLERLATAIAIFGSDKRLKFFNGAYVKLWKLDEAWLHGSPELGEIMELLHERRSLPETADYPAYKRKNLALFTTLMDPMEDLLHLPDGSTLRTVVTPHPMGGLLFTYEDVTDRLALERSYNTLIDVQRETLNNLSEGVAVFGSDGRLKLCNPVYARMWRLDDTFLASEPHIADVLEATKHLYLPGKEGWPALKDSIIAHVTGRGTFAGHLDRSDGAVIDYSFTPLPDAAVQVGYLDVTDSTRVERALMERAEALETADRLKSEFLANVSYELRTPLNSIIGFSEILHNQYFGALNERQNEYTDGILESSRQLLALINNILDLASIEAGGMALEIKTFAVADLVSEVIDLARPWVRSENITLDSECAADSGEIDADVQRLKQVLFNLISNAVKFTPAGGNVKVAARRVGDDVELSVSDTGIGISEQDRQRVFDKFERGKDFQGRVVGAGLGLSLVKNFIELHGGSVTIDSAPEKGTTVICRLPVRHADTAEGAKDADAVAG